MLGEVWFMQLLASPTVGRGGSGERAVGLQTVTEVPQTLKINLWHIQSRVSPSVPVHMEGEKVTTVGLAVGLTPSGSVGVTDAVI